MSIKAKAWADEIITHMKRVGDAAKALPQPSAAYSPGGTPSSPSAMSGAQIAVALAEYCRNNNSTTQSLAIRLANISARYPQRAA